MFINTTVYINSDILLRLNDAAAALDIQRNELVSMLFHCAFRWQKDSFSSVTSVRYQESDPDVQFKRMHIRLKNVFYEKCIDMRKVFKFSVSLVLALAVKKELDKLIRDLKTKKIKVNTDNYHTNYLFIAREHENIFSFTIFWDYPKKKTLKKYLN